MAVQERDYMKGGAPAAVPGAPAGWIDRLNELGERHATAIIAVSTGLIILTVLIFAKYFYDKSQVERAEQELSVAEATDQLAGLKIKYGATPVAPRILFRLANKYNEEGNLNKARLEYKEFLTRYPTDRLAVFVTRSLAALEKNLAFDADGKDLRLKQSALYSHPRQFAESKDARIQWGPVVEGKPVVEIDLGSAVVKAELFEDEAPNAVAAFVKLAEQKYFDGIKWEMIGSDERLQTQAKAEGAVDLTIAAEDSKKTPEAFSLVLSKKDAGVSGSQFQILLRAIPDLKDATVFGSVTDGMTALKAVKKGEPIKSVKIVSKRSHSYEPAPLKK